jgi:hypothetical protein
LRQLSLQRQFTDKLVYSLDQAGISLAGVTDGVSGLVAAVSRPLGGCALQMMVKRGPHEVASSIRGEAQPCNIMPDWTSQ